VVILATEAGLAKLDPNAFSFANISHVHVFSAYEAAAEVLRQPTLALVVELRVLGSRNLGLLKIARDMNVEVLAFGSIPKSLSGGQLSGVRLVSAEDAAFELGKLAASSPQLDLGTYEKAEGVYEPIEQKPQSAEEKPRPKTTQNPDVLQQILTPEELEALLEDN